jgi:hypothetical protein
VGPQLALAVVDHGPGGGVVFEHGGSFVEARLVAGDEHVDQARRFCQGSPAGAGQERGTGLWPVDRSAWLDGVRAVSRR